MSRNLIVLVLLTAVLLSGCLESQNEVNNQFEEIDVPYEDIALLTPAEDSFVYAATNRGSLIGSGADFPVSGGNVFLVYEGEEYGESTPGIYGFAVVDGDLVWQEAGGFRGPLGMFRDGEEIGPQYEEVRDPTNVGGYLAYVAEDDGETFVVYRGEERGKQYDFVRNPTDVGGIIAYIARDGNSFYVVFNGTERGPYDDVKEIYDVNGEIGIQARRGGRTLLVTGDSKSVLEDNPRDVIPVGDGLAYSVVKHGEKNIRSYVVYEGEIFEPPTLRNSSSAVVSYLSSFGDKPGFVVNTKGEDAAFIGRRKLEKTFPGILGLTSVGGTAAYVGFQDGEDTTYSVVYGDTILGPYNGSALFPIDVQGRLVYAVKKSEGWTIIRETS